jgi:ribosomal protein S18 acetylase RimI-like enzyme
MPKKTLDLPRMENKINIRTVEALELEELLHISRDTFIHNYGQLNDPVFFQQYLDRTFIPTKIEAEWREPHSRFFWVEVNGAKAGYCKLQLFSPVQGLEEAGEQVLEIQRIYVLDPFQKLGLGKLMLQKAIELALEQEFAWIWLGVWKQNHKAIAWYEAQGFEIFGEHIFWMGEEAQVDWLMRKRSSKTENK